MKSVGHLQEHHSDIIIHRQKQLAEVFSLSRSVFAENTAGNLCQPLNELSNLIAKLSADILDGIVRVFNDVMEQGGANAR